MHTPDWLKIAAASKEELATEALKLIEELGGPDSAQEALESLEGMSSKQANWVLDDVYVESEISDPDKKFFSEGEEALGGAPTEKKEETPAAPKKPKKKRSKKPKVVEPEIVEPTGGPLVVRPDYTLLSPEKKEQKAKYLSTVLMALLGLGSIYGLEQWLKQNDLTAVKNVIEKTLGPKGTPAEVTKKEEIPHKAPQSHESTKIKAIRDKLYDNEQKQLALTRDVQEERKKGTEGVPGSSYEKYYEGKAGKELKEVEKELAALRQEHRNLVDQLNKQFTTEREEALKRIPPQKSYEKGD